MWLCAGCWETRRDDQAQCPRCGRMRDRGQRILDVYGIENPLKTKRVLKAVKLA